MEYGRREMERALVVQRMIGKQITQAEAGIELGLSARQMRRLKVAFVREGCSGLKRKPAGGNRQSSPALKEQVLEVVRSQFADFGPTLASEKLAERYNLKTNRETLRQWMVELGLWRGKKRRQPSIYQSRERRSRIGELVQIDGSHHAWFEDRRQKCCLIVMIDDATSRILAMRFEEAETTMGYMRCLGEYLSRYGRPVAFYSDKHSIFRKSATQCVDRQVTPTQFHRALRDLGIDLVCASSPQAKGRVERANGTLQDRLVKEMRLREISTLADANAFLEQFREQHNARFAVRPAHHEDAHRPLLHTDAELRLILSRIEHRRVSKNLEVMFEDKLLQLRNVGQGYRLRHAQVSVHETTSGELLIIKDHKPLDHVCLRKLDLPAEVDDKTLNDAIDTLLLRQDCGQSPRITA